MFQESSSKSRVVYESRLHIQTDASVLHGPSNKGYVRHYEGTSRAVLLYSSIFLLYSNLLSQDGIYFSKHCCCCHRRFSVSFGVQIYYIVIFVVCMRLWLDREFLG